MIAVYDRNPVLFFFSDPPPTEIYTLSLHDALPIWQRQRRRQWHPVPPAHPHARDRLDGHPRSEEHTSELQSRGHLVCRLLLEKKKKAKPHGLPIKKQQPASRNQTSGRVPCV